jgi:hypothetical protein
MPTGAEACSSANVAYYVGGMPQAEGEALHRKLIT